MLLCPWVGDNLGSPSKPELGVARVFARWSTLLRRRAVGKEEFFPVVLKLKRRKHRDGRS